MNNWSYSNYWGMNNNKTFSVSPKRNQQGKIKGGEFFGKLEGGDIAFLIIALILFIVFVVCTFISMSEKEKYKEDIEVMGLTIEELSKKLADSSYQLNLDDIGSIIDNRIIQALEYKMQQKGNSILSHFGLSWNMSNSNNSKESFNNAFENYTGEEPYVVYT